MTSEDRKLPRFEGKDFSVWKAQVLSYLVAKDWDPVLLRTKPRRSTTATPEEAVVKEQEILTFEKVDKVVRSQILLALDGKYAKMVLNCKTSKEIWDRLSAIHEQRSAANKISLQKEFFDIRMEKDETVHDYISRAEYLHGQLGDVGVTGIDESVLIGKIVSGLPKRYLSFMSNWSNLDNNKQTLVELIARLSAEEKLLSKFKKPSVENAFYGEGSSGKDKRHNPKKSRNSKKSNSDENNSKKQRERKCWSCGKNDHLRSNCPDRVKKKDQEKPSENKPKSNNELEEGSSMIAEEANLSTDHELWIIDTGATCHMSYDKRDFCSYKKLKVPRTIRFGGSEVGHGIAVGDVKLISSVEGKRLVLTVKDVLHVPNLRRRLFSVSAASKRGCKGEIELEKLTIRDKKGRIQLVAKRQNDLYLADTESISLDHEANSAEESKLSVWHQRYGHIGKTFLLKTSQAVDGLEEIKGMKSVNGHIMDTIDCVGCCMGKQSKAHIPSRSSPRATEVGQVVHMDIGGPVGASTLSGCTYYILFKDEFSNYRFVFLMKSREEAFDCIRKVVTQILADTKAPVRYIMSDCGTEFTSKRSQEFFLEKGIVHKTAAPFTPAQNGFIERDNRTLMNGVRSMLYGKNLPMNLWGEAANSFVYLLNRSVNSNTVDKTPYEKYFKLVPKIKHLKIFGCLALVKTQTKKRSGYQKKLEERAIKGVMVGYEQDFTYRILDPVNNKIIVSRDVIFDESKTYFDTPSGYDNLDNFIDSQIVDEDSTDEMLNASEETAGEPTTYYEAINSNEADKWKQAMKEEYMSLIDNKTWDLVTLPYDRKPVSCKWVYKLKFDSSGGVSRYKARLVARGFTQKEGIDYKETFSPVVRLDTVRAILILANHLNLEMLQMDVKTAFLNGSLEEEIYMSQPQGFEQEGKGLVCRLRKSIYGLKQASLQWNRCFTSFLRDFSLKPLKSDSCVFVNQTCNLSDTSAPLLIICIYVDDGLIMSNRPKLMEECLEHLRGRFEMKTGSVDTFVGLQIRRNRTTSELYLSLEAYIKRVVDKHGLSESKSFATPMDPSLKFTKTGVTGVDSKQVDVPYRQVLGTLTYISTAGRPDITFSVNLLARFAESPRLVHWSALKRILKYLVGRENEMIVCKKQDHMSLECFSDSDYGGCLDTRRSTSGYIIFLNSTPVIWKATRQTIVATSTCEAEFVSAAMAAKDLVWLRNLLVELGLKWTTIPFHIDNLGTVKLIENNQVHAKTKHLDIKLHYIRDINKSIIKVKHIPTEDNISDILTKPLPKTKFVELKNKILVPAMIKSTLIGLTLLTLACIEGGECFLLKHPYEITPRLQVMAYENVCLVMAQGNLEKELKTIGDNIQEEIKARHPILCRSPEAHIFEYCSLRYTTLVGTIGRFANSTSKITKRNLVSDSIYEVAFELPRVVGAGATMWLKGESMRSVAQTAMTTALEIAKKLLKKLIIEFMQKTLVPVQLIRDRIASVSKYARSRPDILEKKASINDYNQVFMKYVDDELAAAEVLLGSIYIMLREGRMDTQALGELLEDASLMDINPSMTRIRDVVQKQDCIEFYFDVIRELGIFERIIWMDALTSVGSLSILILIIVVIKSPQRSIPTQLVVAPSSVQDMDLRSNLSFADDAASRRSMRIVNLPPQ